MLEQDRNSTDVINVAVALALNAQLALIGQLLSTLLTHGVLTRAQASELVNKLAETISGSLAEEPSDDLRALTKKPLQDHADALRKIASDLGS